VFVPTKSLSLEEDGESDIPHAALWSMKYHRHVHLFDRTDVQIRQRFGTGDHAIYIIDDGSNATIDDVPSEYLGPNGFIEFADDPASAREESFSRDPNPGPHHGTGRDPRS